MLFHRIATKVGTAIRQGRTFHGFKAACGASIVASTDLALGSRVSIGPEPHTLCAKCFKQIDAEHIDVKLPEDPLSAPIYDEKGNLIRGVREREEGLSRPVNTHEINLGDNNGLGDYENKPFG